MNDDITEEKKPDSLQAMKAMVRSICIMHEKVGRPETEKILEMQRNGIHPRMNEVLAAEYNKPEFN